MNMYSHYYKMQPRPLDDAALMRFAPAIFAEQPHDSRSNRYEYIPTINAVEALRKAGYRPMQAVQQRSRDASKRGFAKHLIKFQREGDVVAELGDTAPQVILTNSHDGSSSYELSAGLFRLVCKNGLMVGENTKIARISHRGADIIERVVAESGTIMEETHKALEVATAWNRIAVAPEAERAFAKAALQLRWDTPEAAPIEPEALLRRASYDAGRDLWSTFNTVQSGLIRGGQRFNTRDANNRRRRGSVREITGIDQNKAVNRALWTLAEEMARVLSPQAAAA